MPRVRQLLAPLRLCPTRARLRIALQSNNSRFVGSLKKQFAEQESESLMQRTTSLSTKGQQLVECLVRWQAGEPGCGAAQWMHG